MADKYTAEDFHKEELKKWEEFKNRLEAKNERLIKYRDKLKQLDPAIDDFFNPEEDSEKAILKKTMGEVAWKQSCELLNDLHIELKKERELSKIEDELKHEQRIKEITKKYLDKRKNK